jgi:hypothetical protein
LHVIDQDDIQVLKAVLFRYTITIFVEKIPKPIGGRFSVAYFFWRLELDVWHQENTLFFVAIVLLKKVIFYIVTKFLLLMLTFFYRMKREGN